MPPHQLHVAQSGPLRSEHLERVDRSRVDGERGDGGERHAQAMRQEVGVERGGRGGEQRVAPRREEGEVEVGDGGEAARDQVEVARVASESEGGARGPL